MMKYIILMLGMLGFCLTRGQAQNYDFVVAKDGSGAYQYIQDAIDACRAFTPKRLNHLCQKWYLQRKAAYPSLDY